MRTSAASIPSAEVPDIRPRTREEVASFAVIEMDELLFTTEGTEDAEKSRKEERKE